MKIISDSGTVSIIEKRFAIQPGAALRNSEQEQQYMMTMFGAWPAHKNGCTSAVARE